MCVMMSILAFLFSRGRWHISQFFTLITRSKVSPESEPEPDKSSSEEPEDWWVEPDNGNVFCTLPPAPARLPAVLGHVRSLW